MIVVIIFSCIVWTQNRQLIVELLNEVFVNKQILQNADKQHSSITGMATTILFLALVTNANSNPHLNAMISAGQTITRFGVQVTL